MAKSEYPGMFGMTSRGVVAIHADWPAYPAEHGWEWAIASLGMFPAGTSFRRIDDIDQCALFVADAHGTYPDQYDSRAFHVAAWHEDLLDAQDMGLIDGLERITYREYEERRRNDLKAVIVAQLELENRPAPLNDVLKGLGFEVEGKFIPLVLGMPEELLDEPLGHGWMGIDPQAQVRVTPAGWDRLDQLWEDAFRVPPALKGRLDVMDGAGLYDSALRDVGVLIENRMRTICGTEAFGARLIEEFIRHLDASGRFYNPSIKVLRADLRTAFKFIRNEFAHNLVKLPRARGRALLGRMCSIFAEIDALSLVLNSDAPSSDEGDKPQ